MIKLELRKWYYYYEGPTLEYFLYPMWPSTADNYMYTACIHARNASNMFVVPLNVVSPRYAIGRSPKHIVILAYAKVLVTPDAVFTLDNRYNFVPR